jgi:hypothetical protein
MRTSLSRSREPEVDRHSRGGALLSGIGGGSSVIPAQAGIQCSRFGARAPPPPSGGVTADGARRGPATVAVRGCARGLPRKIGPADTRNITPCEFAASGKLSGQTDVASMITYAWLGSLSLRSHAVPAGPIFRAPPTRARTAHRLPRRLALRPPLAPEQIPCRGALQFSTQHRQHAAFASLFPGHPCAPAGIQDPPGPPQLDASARSA